MNHPRQVLTRTQIFEHVWGYDFGPSSNSLEVYVGYLRRKLEAAGEPRVIHTVRGVGYVLREQVSFRRRLALSCGAAVAVAVVLGSALAYWVVRDTLRDRLDDSLRTQAGMAGPAGRARRSGRRRGRARADTMLLSGESPALVRVIALRRRHDGRRGEGAAAARRRAGDAGGRAGQARAVLRRPRRSQGDRDARARQPRARTSLAIFAARPLAEVDAALGTLRWALGLLALAGIAARGRALAPGDAHRDPARWSTLTETAEHVAATRDLSRRIDAQGEDEVSRLATSFNTMLEALERIQRAQRQLVADASHELRTPLTSLRTNLEVLARGGPPDRGRPRPAARRPRRAAGGAERARRRPRRARPRRGARGAVGGGRAARPAGRGRDRAGAPARAARDLRDRSSSPRSSRASRRGWTAPSRTCSTTPRSGVPPGAWSTCGCATAS